MENKEKLLKNAFDFLFFDVTDAKGKRSRTYAISKGLATRNIALKLTEINSYAFYRPTRDDYNNDVVLEYKDNVWNLCPDTILLNYLKLICQQNETIRKYMTVESISISNFIEKILEELKAEICFSGKFKEINIRSGNTSIIFSNGTLTFNKDNYIFKENYFNELDNAILKVKLTFKKINNDNNLLLNNEMYNLLKVKMNGDEEKTKFVCALLYNWINTKQNCDIMPYFYGDGGNGKSIFLNILSNTFDSYVNEMAISSLISKFNNESYLMKPLGIVKEVENIEFRESNGALKSLISRELVRTERKGKDSKMSPVIVKLFAVGNQKLGIKHDNAELVRLAYFAFNKEKYREDVEDLEEFFMYKKQDIINCIIYGYLYAKEHKLYKTTREFGERYLRVFKDELDRTINETRKDIAENKNYLVPCENAFLDVNLLDDLRKAFILQGQHNYVKIHNIMNGDKTIDIYTKINSIISSLPTEYKGVKKYRPNNNKTIELISRYSYSLKRKIYYTHVHWNLELLNEILQSLIKSKYAEDYDNSDLINRVNKYITLHTLHNSLHDTLNGVVEYLETQEER